jgi:hypothetical protein
VRWTIIAIILATSIVAAVAVAHNPALLSWWR